MNYNTSKIMYKDAILKIMIAMEKEEIKEKKK